MAQRRLVLHVKEEEDSHSDNVKEEASQSDVVKSAGDAAVSVK